MTAGMGLRAQPTLETYQRQDSNSVTTTAYRATLTGADSADLTSPLSSGSLLRSAGGRTTVYVAASFGSASATVAIAIVFYAQNGTATGAVLGHQTATLTASAALTRDGTRFDAPPLPFDAIGQNYEIRLTAAPSAGNVSLFTWVE